MSPVPNRADRRKPWYAEGIRFECTQGGKCCHSHGNYDRVYVDDDEAVEIAGLLALPTEQFERLYCTFEDGFRLIRFNAGACLLLQDNRCAAYQARPTQCRTWPFWSDNLERDTWKNEVAPFCPGVGRGRLYTREEIEMRADELDEREARATLPDDEMRDEACGKP